MATYKFYTTTANCGIIEDQAGGVTAMPAQGMYVKSAGNIAVLYSSDPFAPSIQALYSDVLKSDNSPCASVTEAVEYIGGIIRSIGAGGGGGGDATAANQTSGAQKTQVVSSGASDGVKVVDNSLQVKQQGTADVNVQNFPATQTTQEKQFTLGTATNTSTVGVGTTAFALAAVDANRKGFILVNKTNQILYFSIGATPVGGTGATALYHYAVAAGATLTVTNATCTAAFTGIFTSSPNGNGIIVTPLTIV